MSNPRYNWRRYTSTELIYFTNFVKSNLRVRRLELLAEHRDLNRVAKLCKVTPSCIIQQVYLTIRQALWQIAVMQRLDTKFGAGQNAAVQLYHFHTQEKFQRKQRKKQLQDKLAKMQAAVEAAKVELSKLDV